MYFCGGIGKGVRVISANGHANQSTAYEPAWDGSDWARHYLAE